MGLIFLNIMILSMYLILPIWISCIYSVLLKRKFKIKTTFVMLGALFIELLVVGYLYFNPIITYSPDIAQDEVEQVLNFINEADLQVDDIFGFSQKQLPIFVYSYSFDYSYDYYGSRALVLQVSGLPIGYERYYPKHDIKKFLK